MWAEANEDQCRWWLGTTTCTQIAVDAVTPFNCQSTTAAPRPSSTPTPSVREELLLAPPTTPRLCQALSLTCFRSRSHSCFSFPSLLSSVWPVGWIHSPSFVCARYVLQLLNWCFLKIVIHILFFFLHLFFNICQGTFCLLLSCLSFPFSLTLNHLSVSLMKICSIMGQLRLIKLKCFT